MNFIRKTMRRISVPLLLIGLAGCYYPVPVYSNYPAYTYPAYPAPLYGYAPGQQAYPPPYANNGQQCSEYAQSGIIAGQKQQLTGTACRQPDGKWKDTASGMPVQGPPTPQTVPDTSSPPASR